MKKAVASRETHDDKVIKMNTNTCAEIITATINAAVGQIDSLHKRIMEFATTNKVDFNDARLKKYMGHLVLSGSVTRFDEARAAGFSLEYPFQHKHSKVNRVMHKLVTEDVKPAPFTNFSYGPRWLALGRTSSLLAFFIHHQASNVDMFVHLVKISSQENLQEALSVMIEQIKNSTLANKQLFQYLYLLCACKSSPELAVSVTTKKRTSLKAVFAELPWEFCQSCTEQSFVNVYYEAHGANDNAMIAFLNSHTQHTPSSEYELFSAISENNFEGAHKLLISGAKLYWFDRKVSAFEYACLCWSVAPIINEATQKMIFMMVKAEYQNSRANSSLEIGADETAVLLRADKVDPVIIATELCAKLINRFGVSALNPLLRFVAEVKVNFQDPRLAMFLTKLVTAKETNKDNIMRALSAGFVVAEYKRGACPLSDFLKFLFSRNGQKLEAGKVREIFSALAAVSPKVRLQAALHYMVTVREKVDGLANTEKRDSLNYIYICLLCSAKPSGANPQFAPVKTSLYESLRKLAAQSPWEIKRGFGGKSFSAIYKETYADNLDPHLLELFSYLEKVFNFEPALTQTLVGTDSGSVRVTLKNARTAQCFLGLKDQLIRYMMTEGSHCNKDILGVLIMARLEQVLRIKLCVDIVNEQMQLFLIDTSTAVRQRAGSAVSWLRKSLGRETNPLQERTANSTSMAKRVIREVGTIPGTMFTADAIANAVELPNGIETTKAFREALQRVVTLTAEVLAANDDMVTVLRDNQVALKQVAKEHCADLINLAYSLCPKNYQTASENIYKLVAGINMVITLLLEKGLLDPSYSGLSSYLAHTIMWREIDATPVIRDLIHHGVKLNSHAIELKKSWIPQSVRRKVSHLWGDPLLGKKLPGQGKKISPIAFFITQSSSDFIDNYSNHYVQLGGLSRISSKRSLLKSINRECFHVLAKASTEKDLQQAIESWLKFYDIYARFIKQDRLSLDVIDHPRWLEEAFKVTPIFPYMGIYLLCAVKPGEDSIFLSRRNSLRSTFCIFMRKMRNLNLIDDNSQLLLELYKKTYSDYADPEICYLLDPKAYDLACKFTAALRGNDLEGVKQALTVKANNWLVARGDEAFTYYNEADEDESLRDHEIIVLLKERKHKLELRAHKAISLIKKHLRLFTARGEKNRKAAKAIIDEVEAMSPAFLECEVIDKFIAMVKKTYQVSSDFTSALERMMGALAEEFNSAEYDELCFGNESSNSSAEHSNAPAGESSSGVVGWSFSRSSGAE